MEKVEAWSKGLAFSENLEIDFEWCENMPETRLSSLEVDSSGRSSKGCSLWGSDFTWLWEILYQSISRVLVRNFDFVSFKGCTHRPHQHIGRIGGNNTLTGLWSLSFDKSWISPKAVLKADELLRHLSINVLISALWQLFLNSRKCTAFA